jgi:hypothetical protein
VTASHREGQWLGSPNCTPGRQGAAVRFIVLHTMVGTIASSNDRFQNDSVPMQSRASAHYGVGSAGSIVQWVDESDGSWANGDWSMNMESVAIEHEDMGESNAPRPDALYTASAALVRDICNRYGLPIDRAHILDHRQVTATSCPDSLDTDRIVREAAAQPLPTPQPTAGDIGTMIARNHVTQQWETVCRGADNGIWHAAGTADQLAANPPPGTPGSLWGRLGPAGATTIAQPSIAVDAFSGEGAILCVGDDRTSLWLSERPLGSATFGPWRELAYASTTV